ncbi:MAG TPA: glycosyltransferase family 2 protein [Verrucomicrobiae bacterium]|nr:glycosyltransferase family 2 protein [Verrucomicrobiae bacterium]
MKPDLTIVIPMAGMGSRFRAAGYTEPKPLIPVIDRPMYAWAVDSLPVEHGTRLIFVLLRSHPGFEALRGDVLSRYSARQPVIFEAAKPTRGQAETVLAARAHIDNDRPLLIHNADTAFDADPNWVRSAVESGADGALLVFQSQESRWSYSREGPDGWVAEVREKKVVSSWASTGSYWFRRGAQFVRLADEAIREDRREGNEFYVGPLYNELIARGGRVRNYAIRRLYCMGTPEDLAATLTLLRETGGRPAAVGA